MAPLGALMLFNKIVDNGRDFPPLCSSMQQSNSLFLQKTATLCPSPVPICIIYMRVAGLSDTSVPCLKWYLCTETHVAVVRWETGICDRQSPGEGWRRRNRMSDRPLENGRKEEWKSTACIIFSLSLQPQTLGWPGTQIQWVKCVPFQSPLHCNFPPGLPCSLLSLTEKCLPASISRSLYLSLALPSTYLAVHNSTGISKTCFSTTESIATALQQHLCTNV